MGSGNTTSVDREDYVESRSDTKAQPVQEGKEKVMRPKTAGEVIIPGQLSQRERDYNADHGQPITSVLKTPEGADWYAHRDRAPVELVEQFDMYPLEYFEDIDLYEYGVNNH